MYQVEDLRNRNLTDEHASRLKFYCDSDLNTEAARPFVISSETGMEFQRLMGLVKADAGLKVHVCWKGLSNFDDTYEQLRNVYENVPNLLRRLLARKYTPKHLTDLAKFELGL